MSRVSLVVRSYLKDFVWLDWSVLSMRKFLADVDERVLVTPYGHIPKPETLSYFTRHVQTLEVVEGYVAQQIDKLQAARDVLGEFILYVDSDVIFKEPWSPLSRILEGDKCLLYRSRYGDIPEWAWHWRDVVDRYLGIRPEWEYMRSLPIMHSAESVRDLLIHYPDLISRAESITNRAFSEFNLIGVFAEHFTPERYVFSDAVPDQPCKVYWSHGGYTPEIEQEIRSILSCGK